MTVAQGTDADFPVRVVRSARRTKTVQGQMVDGVFEIRVPASLSAEDETHEVDKMVARMVRRRAADRIDLDERVARLVDGYGLSQPRSIRWVPNQEKRWGSCTVAGPNAGDVRISDRLANWPEWVVDYVIFHELIHLDIADHSEAFHEQMDRYPLAERARGFLIAKGISE